MDHSAGLSVEGWCAVVDTNGEATPQLPAVFEAPSGWLAFGGRFIHVDREDVAGALRSRAMDVRTSTFGWRYEAPRPGTYMFFCHDRKIGSTTLL